MIERIADTFFAGLRTHCGVTSTSDGGPQAKKDNRSGVKAIGARIVVVGVITFSIMPMDMPSPHAVVGGADIRHECPTLTTQGLHASGPRASAPRKADEEISILYAEIHKLERQQEDRPSPERKAAIDQCRERLRRLQGQEAARIRAEYLPGLPISPEEADALIADNARLLREYESLLHEGDLEEHGAEDVRED